MFFVGARGFFISFFYIMKEFIHWDITSAGLISNCSNKKLFITECHENPSFQIYSAVQGWYEYHNTDLTRRVVGQPKQGHSPCLSGMTAWH